MFYGSVCDDPRPASDAGPAFRDFVLSHTDSLIPLLETRITQTNEVGRCSYLLPAFVVAHQSAGGRPLALIDVGCSAGLHLRWDRYHYDYGVAQVGDPRSAVSIRCELRGPFRRPLPATFPECRFRLGIDLNPVAVRNPTERRWFEALIWPDHPARRRLAAAAIEELLRDPPALVKGDAVDVLGEQLKLVPPDTSLVVYNSAASVRAGGRPAAMAGAHRVLVSPAAPLAALRKSGDAASRDRRWPHRGNKVSQHRRPRPLAGVACRYLSVWLS